MEEPLKARLIGASILVVLAVALVPELLSGPKHSAPGNASPGSPKGTRTVTIDLGGAVAAGAKLEPRPDTVPAPATSPAMPAVESPSTATATATAPTPMPTPAAKAAMTADESAPTEETPPPAAVPVAASKPAPAPAPTDKPAAPTQGGFSVQVGAFGSDATARKLVNDLKADNLPAYIAPLTKAGKTLYRVRVGPTADRVAADKLAAKLKARGLPVSVVPGG